MTRARPGTPMWVRLAAAAAVWGTLVWWLGGALDLRPDDPRFP